MLNTKVKVGSFLMRLREMRRQSEAAAAQKLSVDRDQMSVTGAGVTQDAEHVCVTRLGGQAEAECGKRESRHPKTGSWELGAGTQRRGHAGGELTAEEMKAATQETAAQLWQILARAENRRRNAEKDKTATQRPVFS